MSFDADKLVEIYLKIRDKRSELSKAYDAEDKALRDQQETIERTFLEHCKENGMESIRTNHGTAYRRIKERYWVSDWDTFNQYVKEHDILNVYTKNIMQSNMRQFLEDNPEATPPINIERTHTITINRSKTK